MSSHPPAGPGAGPRPRSGRGRGSAQGAGPKSGRRGLPRVPHLRPQPTWGLRRRRRGLSASCADGGRRGSELGGGRGSVGVCERGRGRCACAERRSCVRSASGLCLERAASAAGSHRAGRRLFFGRLLSGRGRVPGWLNPEVEGGRWKGTRPFRVRWRSCDKQVLPAAGHPAT